MRYLRHSVIYEVAAWWIMQEYDYRPDFKEKVDRRYPHFREWKKKPDYELAISKNIIQNVFSIHKNWAILEGVDWRLYELTTNELSFVVIHPILPDWRWKAGGNYTIGELAQSASCSKEEWAEVIRSLAYSKVRFETRFVAKQIGVDIDAPSSWGMIDGMHRAPALILRHSNEPVSIFIGFYKPKSK